VCFLIFCAPSPDARLLPGSADFSTPYGYQCNLMVYEPGGYSFSDYLKFGMPLQIVCGVFTVAIVFTLDYWWAYAVAFAFVSVVIVGGYFFFGGTREREEPEASSMSVAKLDLVALGLKEGAGAPDESRACSDNVLLMAPGAAPAPSLPTAHAGPAAASPAALGQC